MTNLKTVILIGIATLTFSLKVNAFTYTCPLPDEFGNWKKEQFAKNRYRWTGTYKDDQWRDPHSQKAGEITFVTTTDQTPYFISNGIIRFDHGTVLCVYDEIRSALNPGAELYLIKQKNNCEVLQDKRTVRCDN